MDRPDAEAVLSVRQRNCAVLAMGALFSAVLEQLYSFKSQGHGAGSERSTDDRNPHMSYCECTSASDITVNRQHRRLPLDLLPLVLRLRDLHWE